jgi:hypothetical protein
VKPDRLQKHKGEAGKGAKTADYLAFLTPDIDRAIKAQTRLDEKPPYARRPHILMPE